MFIAAKFSKIDLNTSAVDLSNNGSSSASRIEVNVPVIPRAPLASFLPQPKCSNDDEIYLDELDDEEEEGARETAEVPKTIIEPELRQQEEPQDLSMKSETVTPSSITEHLEIPEVAAIASPPKKKFKRRNKEMYAGYDND